MFNSQTIYTYYNNEDCKQIKTLLAWLAYNLMVKKSHFTWKKVCLWRPKEASVDENFTILGFQMNLCYLQKLSIKAQT